MFIPFWNGKSAKLWHNPNVHCLFFSFLLLFISILYLKVPFNERDFKIQKYNTLSFSIKIGSTPAGHTFVAIDLLFEKNFFNALFSFHKCNKSGYSWIFYTDLYSPKFISICIALNGTKMQYAFIFSVKFLLFFAVLW